MSIFHARWSFFEPRKPRHPLLRAACALIGLMLLALLLVFGLVLGTAMLAFAGLMRLLGRRRGDGASRGPRRPSSGGSTIEGEYSVVRERGRALPH